jgi:hypothetical protein
MQELTIGGKEVSKLDQQTTDATISFWSHENVVLHNILCLLHINMTNL